MKKLTKKRYQYLLITHRAREKRRIKRIIHRKKLVAGIVEEKHKKSKRGFSGLLCPSILCLEKNYEKVAKFVVKLRDNVKRVRRFRVDFSTIKYISPSGALLLASELDRWRRLTGLELHPYKLKHWDKKVKVLFHQFGLFKLLSVKGNIGIKQNAVPNDIRFIRYLSGDCAEGAIYDDLLTELKYAMGKRYEDQKLYKALSEAMTNVVHHAYPDEFIHRRRICKNRWWLAGSFNRKTSVLTIHFFDQGVGIPETLPKQDLWEIIKQKLTGDYTHADMIRAALEVGRTQTGEKHRGKGLPQLLEYAKLNKEGTMTIMSDCGKFVTNGRGEESLKKLPVSINGTFLEWSIKVETNNAE